MFKPKLAAAIGCAAVTSLVVAACGGGGGGSESITLRVATGLSAKHAWWEGTMVPWMDKVEKLTGGQVTFKTFTGGELVEVPNEVQAVQRGTVDVSLMLPIYKPGQFPMAEVTMLPISHSNTKIASKAWQALLESDKKLSNGKTYYESMFGDKGLKAWPVSATQEYSISTTGKALDSVQAVKGTALRTPSRIHEMYAQKVGVSPVTIPAVEMYNALSRGAFDGSFYSIADWSGYGFQDLFKWTLTGINFGHFNAVIGMTQDTWNGLPASVQDAMEKAHEQIFMAGAQEWVDRADKMVKYNKDKGGKFVKFDSLGAAVRDHYVSGVVATWNDYIKLLKKDGIPGKEIAMLWRDLLVKAGGEVPDEIAAMQK